MQPKTVTYGEEKKAYYNNNVEILKTKEKTKKKWRFVMKKN